MKKCRICNKSTLKNNNHNEILIKSPCNYCNIYFHESCIQRLISKKKRNRCPICKSKFKEYTKTENNQKKRFMYSIPETLSPILENEEKDYPYHSINNLYQRINIKEAIINCINKIGCIILILFIINIILLLLCNFNKCLHSTINILLISIYVFSGLMFLIAVMNCLVAIKV